MIAYNKKWLDDLDANADVEAAFDAGMMDETEKQEAFSFYSTGFYSPHFFIRLGLFILTVVIACFSLGLLSLLLINDIEHSFGGVLIFFGIVAYGCLEFFVRVKHHYRSGVDDALLWIAATCIFSGFNLMTSLSLSENALLVFLLAVFCMLRFADMLMGAVAGLALLAVIFYNYITLGSFAKATVPFLVMFVAAVCYLFILHIKAWPKLRHYRNCCIVLEIVMLVCFYAASNYFVVRQLGQQMFGIADNYKMPYGWLFWIFTACIPFVYILGSIIKKDRILMRVGLLLIAAIVFTVRYYYQVMPLEAAMVLAGIILIITSYGLTKYLSKPRHGFTSEEVKDNRTAGGMNLEAIIIAETFSGAKAADNNLPGGGSFGGGGASGDF